MTGKSIRIILIAEDNSQIRILIEALESGRFAVIFVRDVMFAREILARNEIDLIIVDVDSLPEDGDAILKKIKSEYPTIGLILLTGSPESALTHSVQVDGIVARPFRISHIEDLIKSVAFKGRQTRAEAYTVLVVDDDDVFRTLLIRSLKLSGYGAIGASDGKMAYQLLTQGAVSAVITDVNMPYMDGVSLMKHIKSEFKDIPVILITGYFSAGESPAPEDSSPDGFLMKPFKTSQIMELLDDLNNHLPR